MVGEGFEKIPEFAVDDPIERMRSVTDTVIGDAVLGEVVGSYLFAAVAGAAQHPD